ncbi:MAG: hypothetical protein ACI9BW_003224 [Gammaproteobacteria bacterium]
MNWDAWGLVVESVGALGVIVSVIYLAAQIRKQTQEARLAATRDLAKFNDDIAASAMANPELLEIYRKGALDYESLSELERLSFGFFISRGLRLQEQVYLHSVVGNMEQAFYESLRGRLDEQLGFAGTAHWWGLNRHAFGPAFRDHVDGLLVDLANRRDAN